MLSSFSSRDIAVGEKKRKKTTIKNMLALQDDLIKIFFLRFVGLAALLFDVDSE